VTPLIGALGGFAAPVLYTIGAFITLNFSIWRGSLLQSVVVNAVAFFFMARPMMRLARAVGTLGERARR
jgi:hypothetical protein